MPETLPLLTICVPTYNRSSYLRKFLSSAVPEIEKYNLKDEVIIFIGDNNSTDDTVSVIEEFKNNYKVEILYQKNEINIGAVNNIMRLLENANSKFITVFGDDDEMVAGSLPQVLSVIKHNPEILVHHFKCLQTDFIPAGMAQQKLNALEAAERYFYNIGNAGTFIFNNEKSKAIIASKRERLISTCWSQTEIMFLMLATEKRSKLFLVKGIEFVSSDSHGDNVIYNTWYIMETFCFSLVRIAQNVSFDYKDTSLMTAAKKSIPGCKDAIKFFFRVNLFATYYDYKYELTKAKELINENKKQLKGANYFYPFMYSIILSQPQWMKKLFTLFYFLISNRSFKKSKFDKSYAEVKAYQQRKFEIYKQKGKLTEDSERYIY